MALGTAVLLPYCITSELINWPHYFLIVENTEKKLHKS